MGRNIYLTKKEITLLRQTATEWCEIMAEGDETAEHVDEMLEGGLGSALRKLYKGLNGEETYKHYKTPRD